MNMGGFLAIALSILVIFALIFPVVQGNTSVGVFVSLVTSFMAMAQSLTWQECSRRWSRADSCWVT